MTEADWTTCADPHAMLAALRDRGTSERKLRLFAAFCARRLTRLLADSRTRAGQTTTRPQRTADMNTQSLGEGSKVKVRVRAGMVKARVEDGVVTRVTPSRLYVESGGKRRVFVRATGAGYGDDKHCRLVDEGGAVDVRAGGDERATGEGEA